MGLHVGYVARESAEVICGPLRQLGGVTELPGMIVGGWDDGVTEGHFGCRGWMPAELANRLGVTG